MTAVTMSTPAPAHAPSIRRPSFAALTRVELRKMVDTRAGQALLAVVLLLSFAIIGYQMINQPADDLDYSDWLRSASYPVLELLPVVGVLAMASEWTQRTALTTFTLTPRRIRVLAAKLASAIALGLVVIGIVDAVAAAGLAVRGAVLGADVAWGNVGSIIAGSGVSAGLALVMGAAIGALVMQTAVAVVVYFVAPTAVLLAVATATQGEAPWVDVTQAFDRVSRFDLSGHVGQTITPLLIWIVAPLVLGLWRSTRRNIS